MPTTTYKTRWSGIYVVADDGHYWIMDDYGNDEYIGTSFPTDNKIESYRNLLWGN